MKTNEQELGHLWNSRAAAFWKEAAIYWSYAVRGGLAAFVLLCVIAGSYLYMKALRTIPADYPYWRITTPVLALAIGWTPIRTFLREPDVVFLMPAESRFRSYWRKCIRYNFALQAIAAIAALATVWPLYVRVEGASAQAFPTVLLLLLAGKRAALESRAVECRLPDRGHRTLAGLMRWTGAVVLVFTALTQPWRAGAIALILFILAAAGAFRILPKMRVHWDFLIRKEKEHLAAHYTFFSWFADVPKLPAKPKRRMALASLTGYLPFDKTRTYSYLYTKTFVRSEGFAMICRIVLTGIFVMTVNGPDRLTGLLIYATAMVMTAAAVSGLHQAHRYSFWPVLYPVSGSLRAGAIMRIALIALIAANSLLGAAFLVWFRDAAAWGAVAAGYGYAALYSLSVIRKRALKEEE